MSERYEHYTGGHLGHTQWLCKDCGVVVADRERHNDFHEDFKRVERLASSLGPIAGPRP